MFLSNRGLILGLAAERQRLLERLGQDPQAGGLAVTLEAW